MIGFIHYRQRKLWAWDVIEKRLPEELARQRSRKVKRLRSQGFVPGIPEWSYEMDGNYSFMWNRVTGEKLHIDALNGPEMMTVGFYWEYLESHHGPGPAERRLLELFSDGRGLFVPSNRLNDEGLIHILDQVAGEEMDFVLCGIVDEYAEAVETFLDAWDKGPSPALAAVIGDWEVVREVAASTGQSDLADLATREGETARLAWLTLVEGDKKGTSEPRS